MDILICANCLRNPLPLTRIESFLTFCSCGNVVKERLPFPRNRKDSIRHTVWQCHKNIYISNGKETPKKHDGMCVARFISLLSDFLTYPQTEIINIVTVAHNSKLVVSYSTRKNIVCLIRYVDTSYILSRYEISPHFYLSYAECSVGCVMLLSKLRRNCVVVCSRKCANGTIDLATENSFMTVFTDDEAT